jgi:hypothetical protein
LPDDRLRAGVIGELCRVTRQLVIISFFHPVAPHSINLFLKEKLLGKQRRRFTIRPADLTRMFASHGFQPVRLTAQSRYLRTLWLAVFERR